MNSEELEKSLRTEFENHLKNVLAEMRQELEGFQQKFQTEIENHKTRLGDVMREFSARFETDGTLDEGFKESVVEHLRLARDEGARITAEAISEAEQMEKHSTPAVNFNELRDGVNEICAQNSQAEILKSLVNHAAQYVPRGAFFIVKNDYFVGWRVFGKEAEMDDSEVREIFFPVSDATVLGESIRSLVTVESAYGTYDDDSSFLDKLGFGQPDRMYAVPLIARGRGVAVLYADYGHEGTNVNVEALETLMRVAGLTVELLAASRGSSRARSEEESARIDETSHREETPAYENAGGPQAEQPAEEKGFEYRPDYGDYSSDAGQTASSEEAYYQPAADEPAESRSAQDYSDGETYGSETESGETLGQAETAEPVDHSATQYDYAEPVPEQMTEEIAPEEYRAAEFEPVSEESSWSQPVETNGYSHDYRTTEDASARENEAEPPPYESTISQSDFSVPAVSGYDFEARRADEPDETEMSPAEVSQFEENEMDAAQEEHAPAEVSDSFTAYEPQTEASEPAYAEPVETVSPATVASSQPVKTRFSERNVDLPIEVEESERRLHNDARRFARLLVSEIRLYNEQKVNEGRASYDLYERLREAIDRSREMYEKRVQPPVAAKFDYFHYELVNSLAEGDEAKLGGNYPGANS